MVDHHRRIDRKPSPAWQAKPGPQQVNPNSAPSRVRSYHEPTARRVTSEVVITRSAVPSTASAASRMRAAIERPVRADTAWSTRRSSGARVLPTHHDVTLYPSTPTERRRSVGRPKRPSGSSAPGPASSSCGTSTLSNSSRARLGIPVVPESNRGRLHGDGAPGHRRRDDRSAHAANWIADAPRPVDTQSRGARELQSERAPGVHVNAAKAGAAQQRGEPPEVVVGGGQGGNMPIHERILRVGR